MGNCLYLECSSGISGDMMAAALLDLGADREALRRALDSLPVDGFSVKISRVKKSGLDVCDFDVCLDAEHENHDHDMEYLFGGLRDEKRTAAPETQGEVHRHTHVHEEAGHAHSHVHPHGEEHVEYLFGGLRDEKRTAAPETQGEVHRHTHVHEEAGHAHSHVHPHGEEHAHGHAHPHGEEHVHGHAHPYEEEHAHSHAHPHGEGHSHPHEHRGLREILHILHPHGEEHVHGHAHPYEEEHAHSHAHPHGEGHSHPHEHRGLREILHILAHADMTERARHIAERIFRILAEAEAKAHGVPVEEVHFHEVGAVDSIVDIVTAAVCLDDLDITEAVVPALAEGTGFVRCQHGTIPVPVPAVLNIVEAHRLRLRMTQVQGELVTPTGAAIAAAVCTSHSLPESFEVIRTGLGAGKRKYERPSILRAMLIREGQDGPVDENRDNSRHTAGSFGCAEEKDCICKLETNIDDCTGEMLGCVMERLFEAGARDVHYTPVFMKKNRPAYQLNVICREEDRERLEQIIFRETTTIGIRRVLMERTVLRRESREAETSLGTARVKVCSAQGLRRVYPEYESVAELSRRSGLAFQEVYDLIQRECARMDG